MIQTIRRREFIAGIGAGLFAAPAIVRAAGEPIVIRAGALKRPGFILGAFSFGYAVARSIGEHFREPDPQLGFLWGGLTMGTLLSLPLMLAGIALMAAAMRKETARRT